MIRTILVAVDASPRATHVVAAAAELARASGATMHLFRAVSIPPELPPAGAGALPDGLDAVLARSAMADLTRLATEVGGADVLAPAVGNRSAWRAIVEAAEDVDADLIVIGSHGYGGLDRVLGTTAARVVNHALCNVLVVHRAVW